MFELCGRCYRVLRKVHVSVELEALREEYPHLL